MSMFLVCAINAVGFLALTSPSLRWNIINIYNDISSYLINFRHDSVKRS